jgi:hypothetical protein
MVVIKVDLVFVGQRTDRSTRCTTQDSTAKDTAAGQGTCNGTCTRTDTGTTQGALTLRVPAGCQRSGNRQNHHRFCQGAHACPPFGTAFLVRLLTVQFPFAFFLQHPKRRHGEWGCNRTYPTT